MTEPVLQRPPAVADPVDRLARPAAVDRPAEMVDRVPLARLLERDERHCAISNRIIAAHPLDEVGRHPAYVPDGATLDGARSNS